MAFFMPKISPWTTNKSDPCKMHYLKNPSQAGLNKPNRYSFLLAIREVYLCFCVARGGQHE